MALLPTDADLQTHKFLRDAHEMLGTIDNLVLDGADTNRGSDAIPDKGSIRDMAIELQQKLDILITRG